jgi:hypothetical protein
MVHRVVVEIERKHVRDTDTNHVWCNVHDMHPADCFPIHFPLSSGDVRKQIR